MRFFVCASRYDKEPNKEPDTCIAYKTLSRVVVKSFRFLEIKDISSLKLSKI